VYIKWHFEGINAYGVYKNFLIQLPEFLPKKLSELPKVSG
jgi:hypothetical protein